MEIVQAAADQGIPPRHVAIIMDGNGRWAKMRGLPRTAGHKRGAESVRNAVSASRKLGISYLTLFGFSSENWKRPEGEVRALMGLLRLYLRSEVEELHKNGVRLRVLGERSRLDPDIVSLIENAEARTRDNTELTLLLALSYGSRQEMVNAAKKLAEEAKAGLIDPEEIDEEAVAERLFTAGIPDPDLLIRTSGECRISNFLLWQCAYAEMLFLDTLWPDFGEADLERAVRDFICRDRRYGAVAVG
jgi:undecaprenyl diphosphate synthase